MNEQSPIYEEQWMVSQIASLRHLRSDYSLTKPESKVATKLLTDLMLISETQNPFTWLQSERGLFCALLTLTQCLNLGRRLRLSQQKRIDTYQKWGTAQTTELTELEDKQNILYGHLLEGTEEWQSYEPWDDTLIEPHKQDLLRQALQNMQQQAHLLFHPRPTFSLQNRRDVFVLSDLLRLPPTIDPLSWLREERSDIIAYITFASLLDYILPPKRMIVASAPTNLQSLSNAIVQAGNDFEVTIQQVVNRQLGFTIDINVNYIIPKEMQELSSFSNEKLPHKMLNWKGFEHIEDTNGYSYVSQVLTHRRQILGKKRCQEHLTLACWPPLEGPMELVLKTQPALFAVYEAPVFIIEGRPLHTDTIVPRPGILISSQLQTRLSVRETNPLSV